MFTRNRSIAVIVFSVFGLMGIGWVVGSGRVQAVGDDYPVNIQLLQQITSQIQERYVDEIDSKEAVDAAIRGMLDALDPYTEFLEKKQNDEMKMMQIQGKYGGLGIKIQKQDDVLVVVGLFDDTPAYNVGIQTGDRIVKIEQESTAELDVVDAADLLRGDPGTSVTISVDREDATEEIRYIITRSIITIPVVPYAGVIQDNVGYIKLNHFTEDAGIDVERALKQLKARGVKGLVFDLRRNPGGLLEQAVSVASKFLDEGSLIVYTKGREGRQNKKYSAKSDFVVRDIPLVVLVDEYSASASEIVAGAIQDWDRGVIVGITTFGKALVQQIFPMANGTALKITTARYYTPSGRLIQKIEYKNQKAKLEEKSEEEKYYTNAGRVVYGGGGISPDFTTALPEYPRLVGKLYEQGMFVKFAAHYTSNAPEMDRDDFEVTDAMIQEFRVFLKSKEFTYTSDSELELDKLEEIARKRQFNQDIFKSIETLRSKIQAQRDVDFTAGHDQIQAQIGTEVGAKLWGDKGRYSYAIQHDPDVQTAVNILKDQESYRQQLSAQTLGMNQSLSHIR
ncbi:MAG: S41 family peptidase [Gemmatimonadota bacterium]|nr:S41 family peptidase [Gemmatimonadota bacterium]